MASLPAPSSPRLSAFAAQAVLAMLAAYAMISSVQLLARWGVSAAGMLLFGLWLALAWQAWPLLRGWPRGLRATAMIAAMIALRLGVGWLSQGRISPGDPHSYLVIAGQLIAGQGYFIDERYMGVRTFALFPPVYPLLLAGWGWAVGLSTWSVLALGSLIDALAALALWRIGARLGQSGAGRATGFLYLIWPSVLFSTPRAAKEGLSTLLILLLALIWLERAHGGMRGWRGIAALGMAAGLLALTQPGQAPLAALFGIALIRWVGWRPVLRLGIPAALVAMLVMLPWWARNWIVFGGFVPLTTASGISLWIGNNANATGGWMPQPAALHGLPERVYSARAGSLAADWILGHPLGFVRLTIAKFLRAVALGEFSLIRLAAMYPPISAALAAMLFPLTYGSHMFLLALSAVGLGFRRTPGLAILTALVVACFAQLLLFGVWFEFGERHRDFLTPFLLLVLCIAATGSGTTRKEQAIRLEPALAA